MTYAAPLDDMRFVLTHLADLSEIAMLAGFEEAEPELVEAILIEAARFATEVLAPLNASGDQQGCHAQARPQHCAPGQRVLLPVTLFHSFAFLPTTDARL